MDGPNGTSVMINGTLVVINGTSIGGDQWYFGDD